MQTVKEREKKENKKGGFPKEGRPSVIADRPMGSCGNRAIKGQVVVVNSIVRLG